MKKSAKVRLAAVAAMDWLPAAGAIRIPARRNVQRTGLPAGSFKTADITTGLVSADVTTTRIPTTTIVPETTWVQRGRGSGGGSGGLQRHPAASAPAASGVERGGFGATGAGMEAGE